MKHGPWTSGPRELLDHARDHLAKATDVDNRFAMISVDNAVELMLKTYLMLPKRVTGLSLTGRERAEDTRYFSTALSAVERLAPARVRGVPLGEIEYFHRIRNQLYHEGNIITVERDKVRRYLGHAQKLMDTLFGGETKNDVAERYVIRRRFWTGLLERAKEKTTLHARISPGRENWIGTGAGKQGLSYTYVIRQHDAHVELYVDRGKESEAENKAIFDELARSKDSVEAAFIGALEWQRLDGRRACRIKKNIDLGGYRDEDKWPHIHDAMIDAMIRLERALKPHIANLAL